MAARSVSRRVTSDRVLEFFCQCRRWDLGVGSDENYNQSVRGILTMLATVACLALAVLGFGVWSASPHSPDLRPDVAAELIAARPEFNRYATLVTVSQTIRGRDSLNTCCYTADFLFRQNGSTGSITGRADFRFYDRKWHLSSFRWGKPPNVNTVWVGSDSASSR